jgi:hypothetical protein
MKEKPREKERKGKTEPKPVEKEQEKQRTTGKQKKIHRPEVVVKEQAEEERTDESVTASVTANESPVSETEVLLPEWGTAEESGWMYGVPSRNEDKAMWAEEWGDFLLEWAQSQALHVLSLSTFLKEPPFRDLQGKVDAFRIIGDALVEKQVADWLDRGRRQLRVYWRPLEDWADIVYEWAIRTGHTLLDLKSIVIQESGEDFAHLPERDIGMVLTLIVERGLAVWIDKGKFAIRVEL